MIWMTVKLNLKIDFGSTLAKYNFSEGPYLVVPFLGPRTTRHFSGNIINYTTANDGLKDEISYFKKYEIPVNAIDKRAKFSNIIDDINSSPDPYAKLRSYYIQNRRKIYWLVKIMKINLLKKRKKNLKNYWNKVKKFILISLSFLILNFAFDNSSNANEIEKAKQQIDSLMLDLFDYVKG